MGFDHRNNVVISSFPIIIPLPVRFRSNHQGLPLIDLLVCLLPLAYHCHLHFSVTLLEQEVSKINIFFYEILTKNEKT